MRVCACVRFSKKKKIFPQNNPPNGLSSCIILLDQVREILKKEGSKHCCKK